MKPQAVENTYLNSRNKTNKTPTQIRLNFCALEYPRRLKNISIPNRRDLSRSVLKNPKTQRSIRQNHILVTVTYSTSPEPIKPSGGVCMYVCPNDFETFFSKGNRLARSASPSSAERETAEREARVHKARSANMSNDKREFAVRKSRDCRARNARPPSARRDFEPQLPISPL